MVRYATILSAGAAVLALSACSTYDDSGYADARRP